MARARAREVPPWVAAARAALGAVRDEARAEPMRAYMKSAMPFLGVPKPVRARALRPIWADLELADGAELCAAVEALWAAAEYREERYAALDLLDLRRFAKLLDASAVPTFERLVTEGAWWDLVDACSGPIGGALRRDPEAMRTRLRRWAAGPDLWLRRSALIAQLRLKAAADFGLLVELVELALRSPGMESPLPAKDARFFLHKAVGWALRSHGWTDPERVAAYVAEADLPPLARREATKSLDAARARRAASDGPGREGPRGGRRSRGR